MTDEHDPLAEELAAFRPQPMSPALRARIGRRLSGPGAGRLRFRAVIWASAAVAAACIVWFALPTVAPPPEASRTKPEGSAPEKNEPQPTFVVYHQALNESPEALEALLDRQAAVACRPDRRQITPLMGREVDLSWVHEQTADE